MHDELMLFALDATRTYGAAVARELGTPLAAHEEREFEDGEHKTRPLENVRGRDVYVIAVALRRCRRRSVNDKLVRLLFFLGALQGRRPARVTAMVPYLAYARKDRKSKSRDPVTTRYVAALFEAVGADRVVTLDVHNLAAYQNAFRCRTEHLEARRCSSTVLRAAARRDARGGRLARRRRHQARRGVPPAALARRPGAADRAAFAEKYRSDGVVSGEALVGDVAGRDAIIVDDLISGGTTVARAAAACREHGATRVYAAASHGVFAARANAVLAASERRARSW